MEIGKLSYEEKVDIARKRKNLTWQNLSNDLGISVGYIRDLVKGNRGDKNNPYLIKLNEILEID